MKLKKIEGFVRSKQHGNYLLLISFIKTCSMHGRTVYTFLFVKSETPFKKKNSIKCKKDFNAGKQSQHPKSSLKYLFKYS